MIGWSCDHTATDDNTYSHPDGRLICRECRNKSSRDNYRKVKRRKSNKHGIIGDTQIRPGVSTEHLVWVAKLFADEKVNTVIQLGDWADMRSLSSYDTSTKKAIEGADVGEDFEAANVAWRLVEDTWAAAGYTPDRKIYLLGNHEQRIERYVTQNPEHRTTVNYEKFNAAKYGWEVFPFLEVVVVDGIRYSHYFPRSAKGRTNASAKYGAPSALDQIKREMRSCTAGHTQGLCQALYFAGPGVRYRSLILGSSYTHDEEFLTPQGNNYWRGVYIKKDVADGWYDGEEFSFERLERMYGGAV